MQCKVYIFMSLRIFFRGKRRLSGGPYKSCRQLVFEDYFRMKESIMEIRDSDRSLRN